MEVNEPLGVIRPTLTEPYLDQVFGEGMSELDENRYIWLTWKDRLVNIVDRNTLKIIETFPLWDGVREGWGITLDPLSKILYVTDGSNTVTKVSADTLEKIGSFRVTIAGGVALAGINELEFVNGFIWATIKWYDGMVKIDPSTGEVVKTVSFEVLYNAEMALLKDQNLLEGYDHANNMCHGIAHDTVRNEFYVTGKRWNLLFKIKLHSSY